MKFVIAFMIICSIFVVYRLLLVALGGVYVATHHEALQEVREQVEDGRRLKEQAKNKYTEQKEIEMPYYITDKVEALESVIESIYIQVHQLEDERNYTFDQPNLLRIDEKIARLRLQAASKAEALERIKTKYRKEI